MTLCRLLIISFVLLIACRETFSTPLVNHLNAQNKIADPLNLKLKDGTLQLQNEFGIVLSGIKLRLHLSDGLSLTGNFQFIGQERGSDRAGAFERFRYGLNVTNEKANAFKATLDVRRYLQPEVIVASLEYEGAALAANDGVQLIMHLENFARGFAVKRSKTYWTAPVFTSDYRLLSASNYLLLWRQMQSEEYKMLVPLAGDGMLSTLGVDVIDDRYEFRIAATSNDPHFTPHRVPLFAYSASNDPYQLPRQIYARAFAASEQYGRVRWEKNYPEIFRSLGWCSWNTYYKEVTEEKILNSIRSLREQQIPVGFVLIDDGWLNVKNDRLAGFDADPKKFPHGLAGITKILREEYRIPHVGIWQTFQGYWSGVDVSSDIGRTHKMFEGIGGKTLPDPRDGAGESFYADWYANLKRWGIDFIKVDNQASNVKFTNGLLPLLISGGGEQRNLQEAARKNFSDTDTDQNRNTGLTGGLNLINCMAMSFENAFNWRYSNIARNSDDYLPDSPQNVKEHIYQNAYNAYWTANFAYPDWDMFQTHDPHGEFHAVARAVSGGPVYFTDEPGKERPELLRRLVFSDGRLLMLDEPGQVTRDLLLTDVALEFVPLKIFGRVTRPGVTAGTVAAFNVNKSAQSVTGAIKIDDVENLVGANETARVAVYQRGTERVTILDDEHRSLPFSLDEFGFGIFTLVPIKEGVAVFGLLDKYAGAAGIVSQNWQRESVTIRLREAGDFGVWLESAPIKVELDGRALPPSQYNYVKGLLRVPRSGFGDKAGAREIRLTLAARKR